jgi:hypothetical protein
MSGLLDGRCLCGCLTYRCDGEPLVTVVCHCKDCQRQTGSADPRALIGRLGARWSIGISERVLSKWARKAADP